MRRMIVTAGVPLLILALLYSVFARNAGSAVSTAAPVAHLLAATPASGSARAAERAPDSFMSLPATTAAAGTAAKGLADATPAAGAGADSAPAEAVLVPPSADAPAAPGPGAAAGGPPVHYGNAAPSTYQSPLTAGQVDDNAKYDDYLRYLQQYAGPPVQRIAVDPRFFVRVLDGQQHPVAGARVQLFDGQRPAFDGRTVSDGRVLFFPAAAGATQASTLRAVISRGQTQVETTLPLGQPEATVSLDKLTGNDGPVGLDLVFLLDATGSMGDEIAAVNATVDSIASRITQLPGSSAPRFGLVAYRDRGDDYVTRAWDFTPDVQQFQANLANVSAAGGGDVPESVNAGLHTAIHLPGWAAQEDGRHLRMIVLVGDAPPHLDYANDYAYPALLQEAVGAGIKIFPIGASGLDEQGEYIFRQFAEVTQGQFVFLTYANGVSGAPGAATTNHVSDFSVNNLDSLVVKLVAGEIGNQTGTSIQTEAPASQPVLNPLPLDAPEGYAPAEPTGLLGLVNRLLAGANDLLTSASAPLWILLLLGLLLWAGRGEFRARRAPLPAGAFAAPGAAPPADPPLRDAPQRASARVASEGTTRLPAAETLAPPPPVYAYIRRQPAAHDTAPLGSAEGGVRSAEGE